MSTPLHRIVGAALASLFLFSATGCSMLGFSPYPVAHLMTRETEEVLERSPRRAGVARELSKEVQPAHFIQPGDELLLEVLEGEGDLRLPADQRVMADGSLDLAQFGRIVVAGMTLEQVEALIQETIAEATGDEAVINVQLVQPIHRYYVIGEVNSPGAYPLTGHETVLDAIMEAGGLTARASACDLLLARPTTPCSCRVTLPVCYRAITQLGDTTTNYHLQPGDRIFVARQSFCEEMLAYVHGKETCPRCCDRQKACRDPRVADMTGPRFIQPGMVRIPAPQPPARADEALLETGDVPSEPGQAGARASEAEALPAGGRLEDLPAADDAQPSSQLDGELEFESLLDAPGGDQPSQENRSRRTAP